MTCRYCCDPIRFWQARSNTAHKKCYKVYHAGYSAGRGEIPYTGQFSRGLTYIDTLGVPPSFPAFSIGPDVRYMTSSDENPEVKKL